MTKQSQTAGNQLTTEQKRWAQTHDWYVGMEGDCIVVRDVLVYPGGAVTEELIPWTMSFRALRDWAGY